MLKISVVIPAYNEKRRIGLTIETIISFFKSKSMDFEFVFVDDGSFDFTKEEILSRIGDFKNYKLISHKKNMGKGAAIKTGMLAAEGDWVLFSDADLSTPISELEKFFPHMDLKTDVIIGSRKVKGASVQIRQKPLREYMGKVFTFLSNLILGTSYSDFTCGFKCFRKDCVKKIFSNQRIFNWSYDSEILFLVEKFKFKMTEVPVVWRNDPNTKVRLLKDTFGSFWGLLKIRFNDLTGKYD